MSPITTNTLGPGYSPNAAAGETTVLDRSASAPPGPAAPADAIRTAAWQTNPAQQNPFAGGSSGTGPPGAGWDPSSFMSSFMDALSKLFDQLSSLMQGAPGASGGPPSQPGQPGQPGQPAQSYFTNASASSVGDPHEAFSGTTGSSNVASKWDNMQSHDDLLSSDSFAGGYRVSTSVTAPRKDGVTQNDSATVTADGGATSVTMNQNGSYSATSHGRTMALQSGVAASLGNGETVTLNADRSLTFDARTSHGGDLSTTLKANGTGGVDVKSAAHDVDLGGYLVQQSDSNVDPGGQSATSQYLLPLSRFQAASQAGVQLA